MTTLSQIKDIEKELTEIQNKVRDISYELMTLQTKAKDLEKELNNTVTRIEFAPVKSLVYGAVGVILLVVMGALVALVVKK